MPIDLTQTSFSTIPSIDYECGDATTPITEKTITQIAKGHLQGL